MGPIGAPRKSSRKSRRSDVELLRARPDLVEAAYNYEFVTRTRETLARPRGARGPRIDSPPVQTLHGTQGASPGPD